MTADGILSPISRYLKGMTIEIFGKRNPAIWDLFGSGIEVKWITIAVFSVICLAFVFKGKPQFKVQKGFTWGLTGVLIGLLTVMAWWVSSYFGGVPRGLAITTPIREFFNSVLYASSNSPFPEFSFLGIFKGTWGVFFILAVPLGAYVSALHLKEFKWKIPPAKEILTVFFGSILMGVGAVIAGGCNLGHGVTGMSTMSLASLVGITAGCANVSPTSSIVIGAIAGTLVVFSVLFFDRIKVDDPVGAISVHGVCGAWGTLAAALFDNTGSAKIAVQLIGICACFVWTFGTTMILFQVLKRTVGLRVSEQEEWEGLDLGEHGANSYPDFTPVASH